MSFWRKQAKPIIGLAPMDGITDEAMRFITAHYGRPQVIFTEFVNVEYFAARPEKLASRFWYSSEERPIVVQLSGVDSRLFYQLAYLAADLGFDGVDINMGCPSRSVTHRGGGGGLIGEEKLAEELVLATRKGISDWLKGKSVEEILPEKIIAARCQIIKANNSRKVARKKVSAPGLSVKTRLGRTGFDRSWLRFLAGLPIEAITVHGRYLSCGHSGPVNWLALGKSAQIAHDQGKIFLGNGGVKSASLARDVCRRFGLDGVLIGRGALGNPWVFNRNSVGKKERIAVMLAHAAYYLNYFGRENFAVLRKHLAWYCRDFPGAKELRCLLVRANSYQELVSIVGGSKEKILNS